jgi:hypothetical protein
VSEQCDTGNDRGRIVSIGKRRKERVMGGSVEERLVSKMTGNEGEIMMIRKRRVTRVE